MPASEKMIHAAAQALAQADAAPRDLTAAELRQLEPAMLNAAIRRFPTAWHRWAAEVVLEAALASR